MKKRLYLLYAAVMLTILTACGVDKAPGETGTGAELETPETASGTKEGGENTESVNREYEKITLTYSESLGGFSFRKDLEKTQTDYAVYYFTPSISEHERNACIGATDKMLSYVDANLPDIEVAVLEQEFYDGVSISENRLYLSPQAWDSADYLAKALLAGYGEWGKYGLAYGYADYLCKKAGLDSGETNSDKEEATLFLPMGVPEAYDLNLLCFNEKFVSTKDVEAAKNNACLFVKEYLSSHSEEEFLELLSASGTVSGAVRAKEALETFYAEKGVECSLSEIRYQYGGVAFDYGAACEYACFYIGKDWQDKTWEANPLVSENFLHEDYGEVRDFLECNVRQMRQYQELFGFDSYNNDLSIVFTDNLYSAASIYYGRSHTIQLLSVGSLMHEYIHSLMFGRCTDGENIWKTEGFARYFSYKYDEYAYDFLNDICNNISKNWVQEYMDTLGRPIDVRTDYYDGFLDIMVHAYGVANPNFSYESGASFIGYLIDQYGEQAVIAYVCSDDGYNEEWGKSYDELVQDWNQYIEENYSQYSKD